MNLNMKKKEKILKKKIKCVFIRINPDEEDFTCFKAINKIHRYTNKSTRELTKKETMLTYCLKCKRNPKKYKFKSGKN